MIIKENLPDEPLKFPEVAKNVAKAFISSLAEYDQEKEHFFVFGVNQANKLRYADWLSMGSMSACIVHPREVFRVAVHLGASAIIVLHNHPSGALIPSEEDIKITKQLKAAGEVLGIRLLDSIIIGNGGNGFNSAMGSGWL